jgi:dinuclear metal center YbgI/SA1388 family protein
MMKIKDITNYLESVAPKSLQESYDNTGLLTGNPDHDAHGTLITLDCTEEVVEEAIAREANLIIAHHPIIFSGLKQLTGRNYVERTIIKAIQNNIAIYAIHTNLDNVLQGVNAKIADQLGLSRRAVLLPKSGLLTKLVTFVPMAHVDQVLDALYAAGAGNIGNYANCSFKVQGEGSFMPNELANPAVGDQHKLTTVKETRVEVILPEYRTTPILDALKLAHPYEEVAYYLTRLENEYQEVGSGLIGSLKEPMAGVDFLNALKEQMSLECIRYTRLPDKPVQKIALCGGSGSFLLNHAKSQGADVFVTADFKYHEFFDAENEILICDIGHYESEVLTKELLYDMLNKKFTNFAVNLSEIVTNPINYYK